MSGRQGAYGGSKSSGDTARKTWDRDEYAQRAAEHDQKSKEESKARYEAAAAGKKYHRRASTPPDVREAQVRTNRLDVASMVGKTQLIAGSAVGRKGKGAGFYCEACDWTEKDSTSWILHLNSRQHLTATGQNTEVTVATKEEVRGRLLWLARRKREAEQEAELDIDSRLEKNRQHIEEEQEAKRLKRREQRKKRKGPVDETRMVYNDDDGVIC